MRLWVFALLVCCCAVVQAQVRINELQSARAAGSDGQGIHGDWVELYNAGPGEVDLGGYVLAMDGQLQKLPPGLMIGPRQWRVLWCDGALEQGPDHLGFSLPRMGGSLLLVAPDRTTVLDLFNWPELPAGVSIGREKDGTRAWGYFQTPTPGKANGNAAVRLLPVPTIAVQGSMVAVEGPGAATIRFTMDGTLPNERSPTYTEPLPLSPGAVVHARAFAPDAVPSAVAVYTTAVPDSAWALALAPDDLAGPGGIADVPSGNHARKGRAWQRQAWLQHNGRVLPLGMAIAGNGSRSLPKRNFKLLARDRFGSGSTITLPDGSAWGEVILRADATPHAFLRNMFMESVAKQAGSRVDVQPSFPVHLFLNGQDQGLYRAMPAKGKEWVRSLNGGNPAEIIEGPGARAISGGTKAYLRMVRAIAGGWSLDSLSAMLDPTSLVELACYDLWTGRADHELNVRCWRPRGPDGRWRWVMFDMDQWAPPDEHTVQRMCSSAGPETPFIPQLLADAGMRNLFLARISALMATTLGPDHTKLLADSLFVRFQAVMAADQSLWKDRMEAPSPREAYADLLAHLQGRNKNLLGQLSKYTGKEVEELTISVEPARAGQVFVEELPLTDSNREVASFSGVAMHFQAVPGPGMEFAGWKGAEGTGNLLTVAPLRNMRITAMFRPVGTSSQGRLKQRME
jgi:hypothetical protein